MDDANTDFSDLQHGTFDGRSERKQHIAALGQWSDQDARYFGPLEGRVGAYGLLETYFQPGTDGDRIGEGGHSAKSQRREKELQNDFLATKDRARASSDTGHQQMLTSVSFSIETMGRGDRLSVYKARGFFVPRQQEIVARVAAMFFIYSRNGWLPARGSIATFDLHAKGAPRPRKGNIPPCWLARPNFHSLLPDAADHGRQRRSELCLFANYPPAPTLNT